jgi:hypothetical protein
MRGEETCIYRVLVGKPEWKRPLGRPRHRGYTNIKIYHREMGLGGGGLDWTDLVQYRDRWWALVKVVTKLEVPNNTGNLSTSWGSVCFSRSHVLHRTASSFTLFANPVITKHGTKYMTRRMPREDEKCTQDLDQKGKRKKVILKTWVSGCRTVIKCT